MLIFYIGLLDTLRYSKTDKAGFRVEPKQSEVRIEKTKYRSSRNNS